MLSLEFAVGGAYATGAIAESVSIACSAKHCCSHLHEERTETCPHCTFCNNTFPFEKVIKVAHDRCTPLDAVVDSILKRKGGQEYLTSKEFILGHYIHLLEFRPMVYDSELDIYARCASLAEECKRRNLTGRVTRQEFVDWLSNGNSVHALLLSCTYFRNDLAALGVPIKDSDKIDKDG